jgi:hypothetical protein
MVDRFIDWLMQGDGIVRGVAEATARKHARPASELVDFLAFGAHAPVAAISEADLRRFVYDVFPRLLCGSNAAARALPGSLERFFSFLAECEGIVCPWAGPLLADRDTFYERCETSPRQPSWESETADWIGELHDDLFARVLIPDPSSPDGSVPWGAVMGEREFELWLELERKWLVWRDDVIASGNTNPTDVAREATARRCEWERTPLGGDGLTPAQIVEAEQRDGATRDRQAGDS